MIINFTKFLFKYFPFILEFFHILSARGQLRKRRGERQNQNQISKDTLDADLDSYMADTKTVLDQNRASGLSSKGGDNNLQPHQPPTSSLESSSIGGQQVQNQCSNPSSDVVMEGKDFPKSPKEINQFYL